MATANDSSIQKIIAANAAAVIRFKAPSRAPRKSQASNQAIYRQRRKNGLQPLKKPWDFITCNEVKNMAWQAYRVAAFELRDSMIDPDWQATHQEKRERFAELLAEMFKSALDAHAVTEGACWPVVKGTPAYRNYPRIWERLSADVPTTWRPEYPVYQEVSK